MKIGPLHTVKVPLALAVILLAAPLYAHAQAKNTLTFDLNPELAALFFNLSKVRGFGIELGYERVLATGPGRPGLSLKGDFKYLSLAAYGVEFSTAIFRVCGRYYTAGEGPSSLFFELNAGGLWHDSPYQNSFMVTLGAAAGWKRLIKGHFVVEPSIGWGVFSGDKFLAPWTLTALSELLIPGLYLGAAIGWAF